MLNLLVPALTLEPFYSTIFILVGLFLHPRSFKDELEAENRIKNRLPSLTNNLSRIILHWEKTYGSVFLYNGER